MADGSGVWPMKWQYFVVLLIVGGISTIFYETRMLVDAEPKSRPCKERQFADATNIIKSTDVTNAQSDDDPTKKGQRKQRKESPNVYTFPFDPTDDTNWPLFDRSHYTPPVSAHNDTPGLPFNVSTDLLQSVQAPLTEFLRLNQTNVRKLVFVTAASEDHFNESRDLVASIQTHMKNFPIYYYDMGLTTMQEFEVRKMCGVHYRYFNFSRYPDHVRKLKIYSFKPIVVHEMLSEHPMVVWLDTSVRLTTHFTSVFAHILRTDGFLLLNLIGGGATNFPVTHAGMYRYIPTDLARQKEVYQFGSGAVVFGRTETVYKNIVYWWLMCALDKDCQAPNGAQIPCNFHGDFTSSSAGCHRFDQSVLNVLAANCYGYNHWSYGLHYVFVRIYRLSTDLFTLDNSCGRGLHR